MNITTFKPLDKFLVETGKVASLERAHELIRNGSVRINGAVITATVCPVYEGHKIEIDGVEGPWVNVQAAKLYHALDGLNIDVRGRTAVDLGAGLGGFAEVLLQKHASKVYTVDTEYGALHSSLMLSPRIKNLQKTNAKDLTKTHIDEEFDLIVTDIGSENLTETLAPVLSLVEGPCDILIFLDDKRIAKNIERFLRLENGFLIKKVPDTLQKESAIVWGHKKA